MKPFQKYLNNSPFLNELLETYLELRRHLQELGFSESELDSPPQYTFKMMSLQRSSRLHYAVTIKNKRINTTPRWRY